MTKDELQTSTECYCYNVGLMCLSICVPEDTDTKKIEAVANLRHPTGLDSRWAISEDKEFHGGQSNPCKCDDAPARKHYLLNC